MDEWLMPGIPRTIADEPDMGTVRINYCPMCGRRLRKDGEA